MAKELTDTCPMPFGQHKGRPMQDVPARYLHWLWCEGVKDEKGRAIHNYIELNMHGLKQEHPDGIW